MLTQLHVCIRSIAKYVHLMPLFRSVFRDNLYSERICLFPNRIAQIGAWHSIMGLIPVKAGQISLSVVTSAIPLCQMSEMDEDNLSSCMRKSLVTDYCLCPHKLRCVHMTPYHMVYNTFLKLSVIPNMGKKERSRKLKFFAFKQTVKAMQEYLILFRFKNEQR